jgi:6-phospho-beta-glucosidase
VLQIAEQVRELSSSEAWIVDFTNPVGIVTRSLLDEGHRAVGLCNVAIGFQRAFARHLGVEAAQLVVDQVGLNHLTWIRAVHLDGRDVLPDLLASHGDEVAEQAALPRQLLDELGVVPSSYLQYFYRHDAILAGQLEGTPRAEVVAEIERGLLELYRDPALNEKPALLEQRGGAFYSDAATGLVTSLVTGDGVVHEVDVRNDGTLTGLADDDVVEVPARVHKGRLVPLPQEPLAPELLGLTQHVAAYERLAAKAAVTGDAATARKALLAHPLIGQHPLNEELVHSLLTAEATRSGSEAIV